MSPSIDWKALWEFLKLILFTYEFNLIDSLRKIDPEKTDQVIELIKIAPGYKPIQYIYTFYTLKYGLLTGTLAAACYPLPYSILFLMIPVDLEVPFVAVFMLAGMRSGALALLLKYCLHFPKHTFHWIVFVFTVLIGILIPNSTLPSMLRLHLPDAVRHQRVSVLLPEEPAQLQRGARRVPREHELHQ